MHRDGERLRVTVELIRVSDGTMLWAGQFNDRFTDLFAVQDSVAQEVAEAVAPRLGAAAAVTLQSRRPRRPEAYAVYLQGRYHWNKRTPDALETALTLFDKALAIDATYASAYAGMADAYSLLAAYRPSSKGEAFLKAKAAAERALQADETLAEAHTSLGFVRFGHEWDWEGAEREYRRAIALDPNYATAHHWYAILLMVLGRADESIEAIRRAERIDPLSPAIGTEVASLLWAARRYDEGIEQVARVRRLHPQAESDLNAGEWYLGKGMSREAIEEFQRARLLSDSPIVLLGLARAHAAAGETAEAERLLERYDDDVAARGLYANPFERAAALAALGRRDDAFGELEKAYQDRFISITWLKVAPSLDPLRGDSRYSDLLRRMRLDWVAHLLELCRWTFGEACMTRRYTTLSLADVEAEFSTIARDTQSGLRPSRRTAAQLAARCNELERRAMLRSPAERQPRDVPGDRRRPWTVRVRERCGNACRFSRASLVRWHRRWPPQSWPRGGSAQDERACLRSYSSVFSKIESYDNGPSGFQQAKVELEPLRVHDAKGLEVRMVRIQQIVRVRLDHRARDFEDR